ncbi:hypothetical protein BJV85_002221 [Clostridium acetobutylicum]|uniref:Predicted membrane protein n=2 Tax=Clostridium acetobutylicum TaxID=1488 RepID=Q97I78_CLOAB|nr:MULTISPECIES: hypothetical protein [Clostridium]AAK79740.1 Predicted membrane protein [Clostridium acetobutylicum ATCC 824]AEI31969.1 hypothetical protein SMB_G1800 [Clostridium acetobutylicum DSM 1731]AWV79825.1 hypothetical protein DK921_06890 [Clostridium acetobutylicum]MBC2394193.1 hypothetical protein [Clostridium acetobutylicum]MBC2584751.1 hypothetical protein [Clostridium acetobutylicum]
MKIKGIIAISMSILLIGSISSVVKASSNNKRLQNLTYKEFQKLKLNKDSNKSLVRTDNNEKLSLDDLKNNKKVIPFNKTILKNKIKLPIIKSGQDNSVSKYKGNSVASAAGDKSNNAPVAKLDPYILNPESLKNGEITTNTQIAWIWSDTDADGDALSRAVGGFPSAYILGVLQDNKGFVTQFTNAGDFDLYYQVTDSKGAKSNIVGYSIHVIPPEDYQAFQGTFQSTTDVKTYNVAVDFSKMDTAAICLTGTSKDYMNLKISDQSGNVVQNVYNYDKKWVYINKPSSNAGICNYTITITPTVLSSNSTYNSYRLMIGNKNDVEAMLSGIQNTIILDKYTNENVKQFIQEYTPNKNQEWFKFTADGSTVITLLNNYPELRFQVRDTENLQVLFDTNDPNNASTHRSQYCGLNYKYAEKARLNTTAGQDYYLVIYSPSLIQDTPILNDEIHLTVGDPVLIYDSTTAYADNYITGPTTGYSSIANINVTNVPTTAAVKDIYVRSLNDVARVSDFNYWKVMAPGESFWRDSGQQCNIGIDVNYVENGTNNVQLMGTWRFVFQAGVDPISIIPGLHFDYVYEAGD